jgi:hypothetical protein
MIQNTYEIGMMTGNPADMRLLSKMVSTQQEWELKRVAVVER